MSDQAVRRARDGDAQAFADLVLPRFDALYGLARIVAGDDDVAQEALQDALTHAWTGLPRLRDASAFDAWLRRLVVNACRGEWRRRRRRRVVPLDAMSEPAARADAFHSVELRDELARALSRLTPDERAVLALRFYEDLPSDEGAAALGISSTTYRSRVHRAVRALRRAIEADRSAAGRGSNSFREVS